MIAAIYGSPRKDGNTDILMDAFLQPVSKNYEIKRFYLRDLILKPCIACDGCFKSGVCVFKDDIGNMYMALESAKAVVFSSPIYFASVTAQLKTFIDRGQALWAKKVILKNMDNAAGKKGFYISVGAVETDKFFLNSKQVIEIFMLSANINYSGDLFFSGVDEKGNILEKPGAVDAAVQAGLKFMEMLG